MSVPAIALAHAAGTLKLATLAAVAAFVVGHPVPIDCQPLPPADPGFTYFGLTYFTNGQPTNIELAPIVCQGWQAPNWSTINEWSPPVDRFAGEMLLVTVHESEHYRYADTNESLTECRALRDFGSVLDFLLGPHQRFDLLDAERRELLWEGAYTIDHLLPPQYHGAVC